MTNSTKTNLKEMSLSQMEGFFSSIGEKPFRAKQVFKWIYRGVEGFDEMTDLSKELRIKLESAASLNSLSLLTVQESKKDGTAKYLFETMDGNTIESVFMKYNYGNSACISSQAGCRMGCSFCASAIGGLERNLTAGEMAEQIIRLEKNRNEKISNIVVMGTGEPFDNYENLKLFVELMHAKEGLNISKRNITVSTCGIIPRIYDFAKELPQVNLAISLHGANDEIRGTLMPINKSYPVEELISACRDYTKLTGRRITFEYSLINGVNDKEKDCMELIKLLKGMLCHVNLIPLNTVNETELTGSSRKKSDGFKKLLEAKGISTTVRRELGSDIDGACGQLRLGNGKEKEKEL